MIVVRADERLCNPEDFETLLAAAYTKDVVSLFSSIIQVVSVQ